jgi:hypothetical protein
VIKNRMKLLLSQEVLTKALGVRVIDEQEFIHLLEEERK